MSARERARFEHRLADDAADGRYEVYKTTAEHKGPVGRKQHHFPSPEEVAQ